ncbi:hypothetical protein MBLNU230_g3106t1 [Neophaeotheca triangularis]
MAESTQIQTLKEGLARLFTTSTLSDLKIKCGWYEFAAHKAVLCAQSEYFRVCCKEGTFKESETGIVELKAVGEGEEDASADEPEMVKGMMRYFYYLDYEENLIPVTPAPPVQPTSPRADPGTGPRRPRRLRAVSPEVGPPLLPSDTAMTDAPPDSNSTKTPGDSRTILHAKAFAIATKYQVPGMAELAASRFKAAMASGWNKEGVARAIHIVFTSTAEEVGELRDMVVQTLLEHRSMLEEPEVDAVINLDYEDLDSIKYQPYLKTPTLV